MHYEGSGSMMCVLTKTVTHINCGGLNDSSIFSVSQFCFAAACNCDTPSRMAAVKLTAIVNPTLLVSIGYVGATSWQWQVRNFSTLAWN